MDKEKVTICTKKDFEVSCYRGSGAGGQARNKVSSAIQIIHKDSGAIGRCSDSRSQLENRNKAFRRLVETPKFKFWLAKKLYELQNKETIEETVERMMEPQNLLIEIKDENGKWIKE